MDIRKCFETLDLDINASLDEAKQAYKDIVNVWHPDRFSHNQRLKLKAETKLKEVNFAYEEVKSFLSSKKMKYYQDKAGEENKNNAQTNNRSEHHDNYRNVENKDRTEHTVEVGTGIVLSLWSNLSKAFRQVINTQIQNFKTEITKENPKNTNNRQWQNSGMRKGMGRMNGSGMGRGRGRRR